MITAPEELIIGMGLSLKTHFPPIYYPNTLNLPYGITYY